MEGKEMIKGDGIVIFLLVDDLPSSCYFKNEVRTTKSHSNASHAEW